MLKVSFPAALSAPVSTVSVFAPNSCLISSIPDTRLTDSTIVDMKLHMPHCQDPAKREFTQLLEVSLAYRKIEWEHVKSGTSGADDWRAPLEA